jgi:hypothetical protein
MTKRRGWQLFRGSSLAAAVSDGMSTRPDWLNAAFGLHDDSSREDILRAVAQLDRTPAELPLPEHEPARSREASRRRSARNGLFVCFRPDALEARICRPVDQDGAA